MRLDCVPQECHFSGMPTNKQFGKWRSQTMAVRGGQVRSGFQESAESLFLSSGYAYESAEEADARFKGHSPGFQYTRYAADA
jgi:O-succinylhomoserine sulfhydrylase